MKRSGIINASLCEAIASLGHTDSLVVCDAGLPIPAGARRIDLAVVKGIPTFAQVLSAIAAEVEIERVVMAEEATRANPAVVAYVREVFSGSPVELVPHERFKELAGKAKAIVRTGEFRSYSNVILYSGVAGLFDGS